MRAMLSARRAALAGSWLASLASATCPKPIAAIMYVPKSHSPSKRDEPVANGRRRQLRSGPGRHRGRERIHVRRFTVEVRGGVALAHPMRDRAEPHDEGEQRDQGAARASRAMRFLHEPFDVREGPFVPPLDRRRRPVDPTPRRLT